MTFKTFPQAEPEWGPHTLQLIRRGVLYFPVQPEAVLALLKNEAAIWSVGCAMGPELFFGRDDGPWIDWDPYALDQNATKSGSRVRDRPWPYCWGDDVRAIAMWQGQPVYIRWRLFDARDQLQGGTTDQMIQVLVGSPFDVDAVGTFTKFATRDLKEEANDRAVFFSSSTPACRAFASMKAPPMIVGR